MVSSDNLRGAFFMAIAMAGFCLNDTMMKLVFADLGLFQAIGLRGLLLSALIVVLSIRRNQLLYRPSRQDCFFLGLRVIGEIGSAVCFLSAIYHMPLANATAIIQAIPLALTLAAALILGEKVGWRRYSAIAVGFAGVMIIVRPGAEGFSAYSLWAVAAVGFMVLRDLSTRRFSPGLPSLFAAFITALGTAIFAGAVALTRDWQPVDLDSFGLLCAAAGFLFFGYLFSIKAMRIGEVAVVSPFRYTIMVWAIVLGIVVFGEIPDAWTLTGAAIVVGMGMYTFYREHRLMQRAAAHDIAASAVQTAEGVSAGPRSARH
ncbi:DMT family transporter [Pelagibius sp. CAU 1746]|uniref:DMT family transporter n=1 Tax=Pelagibius sp. CAU 1746 TaxID=3140370 RepID=UPI00325A47EA